MCKTRMGTTELRRAPEFLPAPPAKSAGVTGDDKRELRDLHVTGVRQEQREWVFRIITKWITQWKPQKRKEKNILTLPGPICPLDKSQFTSSVWF